MAIRFHLDFADEDADFLERMREEMNLPSREEVIKYGLGMLDWYWKERKEGWHLLMERDREQRIVSFPFEERFEEWFENLRDEIS